MNLPKIMGFLWDALMMLVLVVAIIILSPVLVPIFLVMIATQDMVDRSRR